MIDVGATVITVDVSDSLEGLDGISYGQFVRFHKLIRPMGEDQRQHGRRKEGPDGRWPARSTRIRTRNGASKGRAKRAKGRARSLMGRLAHPNTWKRTSTRYSISFQSRASYSQAHQDGATTGNGAKLPKREFLYASNRFMDFAIEYLGDGTIFSFNGGSRGR